MRAISVSFAIVFVVVSTSWPGIAWSAPPEAKFTKLAPYLEEAKILAQLWEEDAKLCEVYVEAEADGTIVMANLQTETKETGRRVMATFHSARAAKQTGFLLDGETGGWIKLMDRDTPPEEGVPVLLPSAMDWDDVIKADNNKERFGVFPNDPDNLTVGIQRAYWNQAEDCAGSSWMITAIRGLSREDGESKKSNPVWGQPDCAADRLSAVSDRSGRAFVTSEPPIEPNMKLMFVKRRPLGLLPSEASGPLDLSETLDSSHWYYVANGKVQDGMFVAKDDSGARVVIDGVASRGYSVIGRLRSKGGHVAYKAQRHGQWYFVYDGKETPIGEHEVEGEVSRQFIDNPWITADSNHWACAITTLRDDGPIGWRLEDILYIDGSPTMHLVRVARPDASSDERYKMMLLGGMTAFDFSPDGKRWVLLHRDANYIAVYIDATPLEKDFSNVGANSLHFTPDGKDVLLVTYDGNQSSLWRNQELVASCSGDAVITKMSNDGSRVALLVSDDDGEMIRVLGGPEPIDFGPAEMVTGITFSPDSQHCAAQTFSDDKSTIVVDGKAVRTGYAMPNPVFLRDGRVVYGFSDKEKRASIVVGDEVMPTPYSAIDRVDVTPRGKVAYIGLDSTAPPERRATLVIDGAVKAVGHAIENVKYLAHKDEAICEIKDSLDGSPVVYFRGRPFAEYPLLHKVGATLYIAGVRFVVEPKDDVRYLSFDESKVVETWLLGADQLPGWVPK